MASDRVDTLAVAAGLLVQQAASDPTVIGGTLMLESGETRFLSLADAEAIVGFGKSPGSA